MQVEIDQRGALLTLLAEQPGTGNRGGGGPDSAPGSDKGHHFAKAAAVGDRRLLDFQRAGQRLAVHRLYQVVGGARGQQIPEQADVVDRAEGEDLEAAAAH